MNTQRSIQPRDIIPIQNIQSDGQGKLSYSNVLMFFADEFHCPKCCRHILVAAQTATGAIDDMFDRCYCCACCGTSADTFIPDVEVSPQ